MGWFSKLMGGKVGEVVEGVMGGVADIQDAHLGKKELKLKLQEIVGSKFSEIEETTRKVLDTQAQVMIAELQQGDKFTKRARPFVVYSGPVLFGAMAILHYIAFYMGNPAPPMPPYTEWFLTAWAGYGSVYAVGRSVEKRGGGNKLTSLLTGSGKAPEASSLLG